MKTLNQHVWVLFLSFSTHSSAFSKSNVEYSGFWSFWAWNRCSCAQRKKHMQNAEKGCVYHGISKGLETQGMIKLELSTQWNDECILQSENDLTQNSCALVFSFFFTFRVLTLSDFRLSNPTNQSDAGVLGTFFFGEKLRRSNNIQVQTRWWFQLHYFYCQPDTWGNDPIWWAYFSIGLVQPPTSKLRGMKPKESLLPFHPLLSDEEFIIAALLDSHGQMGNWFWLIPLEGAWFWEPGTPDKQFKLDGNGETTIS